MAATAFLDACGFNPASGGTGDFVVSAAVTGYQTPASAGATNGAVYSYRAQSSDLSQWEIGFGFYTTGTTTLARTTVTASSTGSKVNFSAPPSVYITALTADLSNASLLTSGRIAGSISAREVLSANRTYYVRTDGSDSNNGLSNTSGGAFLTIQKAVDVACGLDLSIFAVTIQLASSMTESVILKTYVGAGPITILGDDATPSNVTVTGATGAGSPVAVFVADGVIGKWRLAGMKLTVGGSTKSLIVSYAASIVEIRNIDCGSATNAQLQADTSGIINVQDTYNYTISGGAPYHMQALRGGIIKLNGLTVVNTITLTGTPNFSTAFAGVTIGGIIRCPNAYSGSATGKKFDANTNGVIGLGGVTLPGDVAGTTATGGQAA